MDTSSLATRKAPTVAKLPEKCQAAADMPHYIALIHKDPDSDFGVSFPDLPGCVTAGRSLEEALDMAKEALAGHLAAMATDGDSIPAPSAIDAVMENRENSAGIAVLVPAPATDANTEPVDSDDAPEITDEMLDQADLYLGNKLVRAGERGRPKKGHTTALLTLRLDTAVIEHFRETGSGWQSRINDALRAHVGPGRGRGRLRRKRVN